MAFNVLKQKSVEIILKTHIYRYCYYNRKFIVSLTKIIDFYPKDQNHKTLIVHTYSRSFKCILITRKSTTND